MKKITLLLFTLCLSFVSYAQYLTEGFEGGTTIPPIGWTHTQTNANETWTVSTVSANTGTNSAQVVYDAALGVQNETLTSPIMDLSSATNPQVTFFVNLSYYWAVTPNNNYDVIVSVFDGTNTTQIWEEADLGVFTSYTWIEVTLDLTAYAGNSNIQLLFNYVGSDGASLNLDDILVEEAPSCPDPTLTFADFAQTTADITMSTSANYDIEWGEYPYTQGSGGSTATVTAGDAYQLTGLTAGVSYNVFVRQNCGTEFSNYIELLVGTSPDLSTLPLSEDFELDANQALVLNFGLSYGGTTNNWAFNFDDTTDGDTTNDFAYNGVVSYLSNNTFTTQDADAYIFYGPISMTTANEYTFSFYQRTRAVSAADTPAKDFDIVVSNTNDGTATTVLQAFDDIENTAYIQRTVTFTPTTDGDYYFGVHDRTDVLTGVAFGNSVFIDQINVSSMPLSVDEFNQNLFTNYYNKNSKTLNLESSGLTFTSIEIYSTLGQNVISKPLTNTSESINLASLTDGVYLAKVSINGNSKTIKFIKN